MRYSQKSLDIRKTVFSTNHWCYIICIRDQHFRFSKKETGQMSNPQCHVLSIAVFKGLNIILETEDYPDIYPDGEKNFMYKFLRFSWHSFHKNCMESKWWLLWLYGWVHAHYFYSERTWESELKKFKMVLVLVLLFRVLCVIFPSALTYDKLRSR